MEAPGSGNSIEGSMSSINRSTSNDSSNPFFLHHSDNPGLILVSQHLTGDNYPSWSRAMTIALSVKNKLGFINGSLLKPDGNDLNLLNSFRNSNMVISWILNSVSKEISASIVFSPILPMKFGMISRIDFNKVMGQGFSS